MINRNIKWVRRKAPPSWRVDWESVAQDLRLCLWHRMKKWRPGGSSRRTYAIWVLGAFWDNWWRKMDRRAKSMPQFRDPISFTGKVAERSMKSRFGNDTQDATAYDESAARDISQIDAMDAVECLKKKLPPRDVAWLQTYLEGVKGNDLLPRMGVTSKTYAFNARAKVRRTAKHILEKSGVTA